MHCYRIVSWVSERTTGVIRSIYACHNARKNFWTLFSQNNQKVTPVVLSAKPSIVYFNLIMMILTCSENAWCSHNKLYGGISQQLFKAPLHAQIFITQTIFFVVVTCDCTRNSSSVYKQHVTSFANQSKSWAPTNRVRWICRTSKSVMTVNCCDSRRGRRRRSASRVSDVTARHDRELLRLQVTWRDFCLCRLRRPAGARQSRYGGNASVQCAGALSSALSWHRPSPRQSVHAPKGTRVLFLKSHNSLFIQCCAKV